MKVTKLEQQKKDINRVNLYVDGDFYLGVSTLTVAKYSIYPGKDISDTDLYNVALFELFNRIYNRSVEYLSRGFKSEKSVRTYIKNLLYKKKDIWYSSELGIDVEKLATDILLKLEADGYVDDRRYAEAFIESRLEYKPRSIYMLRSELLGKGVSKEIIDEVLNSLDIDELEQIKRVYEKRFGDQKLSKIDRKKIDFLRRKGFGWDLISQLADDDTRE